MKDWNWKQAAGPAPASFVKRMKDTLESLEEEKKPMKKLTFKILAIAVALLLAMAGTAYALNRFGIFDTYRRVKPLPTAEGLVQREFDQQGGENEYFTLTLREALSDGYTVRYLYEFKAKGEDILLVNGWDGMYEDQDTFQVGDEPVTFGEMKARRPVWIEVFLPQPAWTAENADEDPLGDQEGTPVYEDMDTMLIWQERAALASDEALPYRYSCLRRDSEGNISARMEGELSFRTVTSAPVQKYVIGDLAGERFQVRNLEIAFSPLYTYASFEYRMTGAEDMDEAAVHASGWFELLTAEGQRFGHDQAGSAISGPAQDFWARYTLTAAPFETIPEELQICTYSIGPFQILEALPFAVK